MSMCMVMRDVMRVMSAAYELEPYTARYVFG